MTKALRIETADASTWAGAFALVFQHLPAEERDIRIRNAIRLVENGEMNTEGIFVARRNGQLAGALICLPIAGAAALVWPPQAALAADRKLVEDALLHHATLWMRREGAKLAQALLAQGECQLAEALLRNGFSHPTSLWYMRHKLDHLPLPSSPLVLEPYTSCDPVAFRQTLERTYEETLDCPEVNGIRTIEEVVAGHRAQGIHDPSRWWLARLGEKPVGVLMVAEVADWGGWDLSYVGVVPEARGQGHGKHLTVRALVEAQRGGANEVTLSVDTRNTPARVTYERAGFQKFDRREVYLIVWREPIPRE
jgi:mycothiol synthase